MNNSEGLKVAISISPIGGMDIYIYRPLCRGKTQIVKPIALELEEIGEGTNPAAPTLRLNRFEGEELLKSFAEACDERGIKTDNDHKIRGLLEAKEAHLQDMRRLVFEEK